MNKMFEKEPIASQLKIEKIRQMKNMFPRHFHHNEKNINMLAFNRSETLIATCSADNHVTIYSTLNFNLINRYKMDVAIKYIFFSLNDYVIAGSIYENFYVFNAFLEQSNENYEILKNPSSSILSMDISPMNKYLGIVWSSRENSKLETNLVVYNYPRFESLSSKVVLSNLVAFTVSNPEITKFKFYILDDVVFVVVGSRICRYNLKESVEKPALSEDLGECLVRSLTTSLKFEFLLVSHKEGVKVFDPENLKLFRNIETKYPINCSQISNLMYAEKPKFHIIMAGGVDAVHQAQQAEGGNQILIYNLATEERVGEIRGSYGNINWILLFKDGSGVITAGEEGIWRVYRFDISYYNDEETAN